MGRYKICNDCHVAFDKRLNRCPRCKHIVEDASQHEEYEEYTEGTGRQYHAGGEACDYCPHCYGSADWCPYMD